MKTLGTLLLIPARAAWALHFGIAPKRSKNSRTQQTCSFQSLQTHAEFLLIKFKDKEMNSLQLNPIEF